MRSEKSNKWVEIRAAGSAGRRTLAGGQLATPWTTALARNRLAAL